MRFRGYTSSISIKNRSDRRRCREAGLQQVGKATYNFCFVLRTLFCTVSASWLGIAVRRQIGKQKDLAVRIRFGSPLSSEVVVCGHCLETLSLTINETLKWLSSLGSRSHSDGASAALAIVSFLPHLLRSS